MGGPAPSRHRTDTQLPELGGDDIQPFGHVFTDLGHFPTAAGTLDAGGFDHTLDPGQMRRQMATIALGLTGRFCPRTRQSRLSLLLRGLEHPLGQFGFGSVSIRSGCAAADRVGLIVSALDSGHYGVRIGSAHKAALDG
jgi:hypothetical protein